MAENVTYIAAITQRKDGSYDRWITMNKDPAEELLAFSSLSPETTILRGETIIGKAYYRNRIGDSYTIDSIFGYINAVVDTLNKGEIQPSELEKEMFNADYYEHTTGN